MNLIETAQLGIREITLYILGIPLWLVSAAPLIVFGCLRLFLRPYIRLLHPSARATRHRIECCQLLALILGLLSLLAGTVVLRDSSITDGTVLHYVWLDWLLALTFWYPIFGFVATMGLACGRLAMLVRGSRRVDELPLHLAAHLREAAELLELSPKRLPRVCMPVEGPPIPWYAFTGVKEEGRARRRLRPLRGRRLSGRRLTGRGTGGVLGGRAFRSRLGAAPRSNARPDFASPNLSCAPALPDAGAVRSDCSSARRRRW
jgi:hypothetical protein